MAATFTYNTDRESRIDFSRAYYKSTGRMLVRAQLVHPLAQRPRREDGGHDERVRLARIKNCFKDTKLIVTDVFSNALIAFQGDTYDYLMFDDSSLLGVAVTDPATKLTSDLFLSQPYGIGIKQGNTALKAWVDSRLNLMKKRDLFFPILKNTVPPAQVPPFSKNILRPKQTFGYSLTDITKVCP